MKVAVIGCGNMASIIVKAMAKNKPGTFDFFCYNPSESKSIGLAKSCGGKSVKDFDELNQADIFILGFKPQHLKSLDKKLLVQMKGKIIVSILAAVKTDTLSKFFVSSEILRIMPNTPIENDQGIILEFSSNEFDVKIKQRIFDSLAPSAKIVKCKSDKQLDELTTIFGCGPAFVYQVVEVFKSKLLSIEPNFEKANEMLAQLFKGSVSMIEKESIDIKSKLDQVTSKAGVTIEGVKVIAESSFNETFDKAINKALERTEQISQEANNLP